MSPQEEQLEAGMAALEAQRPLLGDAVVDAALGPMRERLAAFRAGAPSSLPPRQALRQVSILFLDIVGSTALSQHLDPEEIGALMDGALARGTAVVEAHGGKVLQYAGDNLLAAFGADEAREDDAERAVRGGLALLDLGRALAAEVRASHDHEGFDVRVGVHTGGVLVGGGVNDDGSIRGIAVNVAARMEQTAPAGALRISADTHALVRGLFDVRPQAPLAVKGVDTPIVSYLVERARPRSFRVVTRGLDGVMSRMVGRDAELAALEAAFARSLQPGAAFARILLVGEAGVGKSRLLYELQGRAEAHAGHFVALQARAVPGTRGQPYGLLHDLLASHLGILDADPMAVAKRKFEAGLRPLFPSDDGRDEIADAHIDLLGQLVGLDYDESPHIRGIRKDAQQIRMRGFVAATLALRRIARRHATPIVAWLDDLHWADIGSLDFIDHLAEAGRDVPILIVGLARPSFFEQRDAGTSDTATPWQRIALPPLDDDASRELADELLRQLPELPAPLRESIAGRAEGNPFYMEELVRMLADRSTGSSDPQHASAGADALIAMKAPPTLTGVLQARLDGLPAEEKRSLQLASVIGLHFWDAALAYLEAGAATQIEPLARRELVRALSHADGEGLREYAFRHQILHQVTYDTVLKQVRRRAHALAATWLAERSGARAKALLGAAAEHYEQAGDAERAAEFYARAAEHAAAMFANESVLDFAARALRLLAQDALALRWKVLATRERTLDFLGRRAEQMADIEALHALADRLDDDQRSAEAAWRHSDIAMRTGDWPTQEDQARRARALAERCGDEELELRSIQRLATAIAFRGDPAAGLALAEAALARANASGAIEPRSRLTNAMLICVEIQGDRSAQLKYAALNLELARASRNQRSIAIDLGNMGVGYLTIGLHAEGRRHLEESLELHRALGDRAIEGNVLSMLSQAHLALGDPAQALSLAETAVAIAVETGARFHLTDALWSVGTTLLALGRPSDGAAAFARMEECARAVDSAPRAIYALDGQARVALALGDETAAGRLAAALLSAVGIDRAAPPSALTAERFAAVDAQLILLTLHRVWSRLGDARAPAALAEAHRALQASAALIGDATLRESYLANIADHRDIVARWAEREQT